MARPSSIPLVIGAAAVLVVADAGCGASASPSSNAPDREDAGATPIHDGAAPAPGDAAADPDAPGLHGTVVDEEGRALPDYAVTLCGANVCRFAVADATGHFVFPVPESREQFLLKTHDDFDSVPPRGTAILPLRPAGETILRVGELFVPTLRKVVPLGPPASDPQTLNVGDGLELTLRRADLDAPLGGRDDVIAARALPQERIGVLSKLGVPAPIGAYALSPQGTTSSSKIGVRLPTTLPAGTKVKLLTVGELDGALSPPVTALSDGSTLTTAPGDGITELTWLILAN